MLSSSIPNLSQNDRSEQGRLLDRCLQLARAYCSLRFGISLSHQDFTYVVAIDQHIADLAIENVSARAIAMASQLNPPRVD